jgi:hypothetical protein
MLESMPIAIWQGKICNLNQEYIWEQSHAAFYAICAYTINFVDCKSYISKSSWQSRFRSKERKLIRTREGKNFYKVSVSSIHFAFI